MKKCFKHSLFLLRLSIGWLFFYAGITKVLDPEWSAQGYLLGAKTFTGFYAWLASDSIIPIINFLNEWGLTLIGLSMILGLFMRVSAWLGALMMIMYYFPILTFPYVGHGFIVDEHIIYALVFVALATIPRDKLCCSLDKSIGRKWMKKFKKIS